MDVVKIQAEALKELLMYNNRVRWFEKDEVMYLIMTDGVALYAIPKEKFFLNLKKDQCTSVNTVLQYFNSNPEKYEMALTDELKNIEKPKCTAIKFEGKNFNIWFNEKRLKKFGKLTDLKVVATKQLAPVGVYTKAGEFLGLLTPLNVKD